MRQNTEDKKGPCECGESARRRRGTGGGLLEKRLPVA